MTPCKFCEFVADPSQAEVVFEDDHSLAFLDARPLLPGHTLLVPKAHFETLPDLPQELLGPLFRATQLLTAAVQEATDAEGVFNAINNRVSQSVPHLHVHIVPRRKGDGLKGFFWPRQKYRDAAHAAEIRDAIRKAVARLAKNEETATDQHG